jgi:hypothetical protein
LAADFRPERDFVDQRDCRFGIQSELDLCGNGRVLPAQPLLAQYRELMSKVLPALNEMVTRQNVPVFYVPAEK